jgi:hypothetical protein
MTWYFVSSGLNHIKSEEVRYGVPAEEFNPLQRLHSTEAYDWRGQAWAAPNARSVRRNSRTALTMFDSSRRLERRNRVAAGQTLKSG